MLLKGLCVGLVKGLTGFLVGFLVVVVETVVSGTSDLSVVFSVLLRVFISPDTVWKVDSFIGTSVTGLSVFSNLVLVSTTTAVVNFSSLMILLSIVVCSSDFVSNSTASVLSVASLVVVSTFCVVGFLVGNISGILLWILSVCGWTKLALSIELSSM